MGVTEADAIANYVAEVIAADMTEAGPADVARKIKADFEAKNIEIDEKTIEAKIAQFDIQARAEVLAEA
jgi:hypothetical protein